MDLRETCEVWTGHSNGSELGRVIRCRKPGNEDFASIKLGEFIA